MSNLLSIWDWTLNRCATQIGGDVVTDKDYNYPYYYAFYGSMPRELTELYIKHGANLMLFPE